MGAVHFVRHARAEARRGAGDHVGVVQLRLLGAGDDDEVLAGEVRERHRVLAGQGVPGWHRDHDWLVDKRPRAQPTPADRGQPGEAEVQVAAEQPRHDLRVVQFVEREAHLRVAGTERAEHVREQVVQDRDNEPDLQHPDVAPAGEPGPRLRAVGLGEHLARVAQERLPGRGQRHVPLGAHEQVGAEFLLQRGDLLGQGRLHDEQPVGGPSEVQFLGERDEVLQVTQFQSRPALVHAAPLKRAPYTDLSAKWTQRSPAARPASSRPAERMIAVDDEMCCVPPCTSRNSRWMIPLRSASLPADS